MSATLDRPSRETVTTIGADGSRPYLDPADTRGRMTRARRWTAGALIVFYLALPWIQIGGHPAVFINIAERRFHLFGATFVPQDLWLLFFIVSGLGFVLFFVTALLGRVWCGWACPQTVFLDHVYRRIERWIDGDPAARRRLREAPWTAGKIVRRVGKHALFIAVSAVITHLFLAYFVSLPEVWSMVRAAPAEHWAAFGFIVVATGALYFNFAWFREQLCIVICPYGRMQSALIDDHSLVIGYDARRGEPRGFRRPGDGQVDKGQDRGRWTDGNYAWTAPALQAALSAGGPVPSAPHSKLGDCVDCFRCVQVCPTGIDIRQGLQMECIGCTACIDACDDVMRKLHRPTGLIRYDSQAAFAGGRTRWIRARTIAYFILGLVGASVATWAFSTVKPATVGITRMTGAPYVVDADSVRNQYLVRLVNKQSEPARYVVEVVDAPAGLRVSGFESATEVGPLGEEVRPLVVQQARANYTGPFTLTIRVAGEDDRFRIERKIEFVGPEARLLREEEAP